MPDTPADPSTASKRPSKITPGPRKNLEKHPESPNWRSFWWYIPLMLMLLWLWQEQLYQISVKTIPYSEFKQHLAAGEVAECEIKDMEITGRIVPKQAAPQPPAPANAKGDEAKRVATPGVPGRPAASGKPSSAAAANDSGRSKPVISSGKLPAGSAATAAPAAPADSSKHETEKSTGQAPKSNEGAGAKESATADGTKKAEESGTLLFRTERVEPDPQLVNQLEAAKVTFRAVRPSFLSQFLLSWLLPIGIMAVIWIVLSRGLRTAGHRVCRFASSPLQRPAVGAQPVWEQSSGDFHA